MTDQPNPSPDRAVSEQRIRSFFDRFLPLLEGLTDKVLIAVLLGLASTVWIVVWCFYFKHYSLTITGVAGIFGLLPTLILANFWWALEELKELPNITGTMMGDAKNHLRTSVQRLKAGNLPRLSFLSAGKGLWSIGSLANDAREIFGSYLSIVTLANPFMLFLGVLSLFGIVILTVVSVVLIFFTG